MAHIASHKLKCQTDSLYPTVGIFYDKDHMETFGFLATIRDAFYDHNMSVALTTRALGLFLLQTAQNTYHNTLHPEIQDPIHCLLS